MPRKKMKDVQSQPDTRKIYIDRVGVTKVKMPFIVEDPAAANGTQPVQATVSMYVDLPKEQRGTHFSRFVRILQSKVVGHSQNSDRIPAILQEITKRLESECAHIVIEFDYFIGKTAPVSNLHNFILIHCKFEGHKHNGTTTVLMSVTVPYTSLCPCSKEISNEGAHNQRSFATITLDAIETPLLFEEVVNIVESCASCPIYNVLKREDEKHVTEAAYKNPMFVEDMVRSISLRLLEVDVHKFRVQVRHEESIHQFDAYAEVKYPSVEWMVNE